MYHLAIKAARHAGHCHAIGSSITRPLSAPACWSRGLNKLQHYHHRAALSSKRCYSTDKGGSDISITNHTPAETSVHPGRLISHFENRACELHQTGWSELWDTAQSDLWDRGKPSPALIDWVESRPVVLPRPTDGQRLKALVPGCGKGYDVVALALHGFDVYGLEVSDTGAAVAMEYAKSELARPQEYNYGDTRWRTSQVGDAHIIAGDFFTKEWQTPEVSNFDLIYDYTFLCALPPELRASWACRMHELLAPTGVLVCLEFPRYKDLSLPGPPWGVNGVYWNLLAQGGDGFVKEPAEEVGNPNGPFKRVQYLDPSRTYKSGEGTDMLSVWRAQPGRFSD